MSRSASHIDDAGPASPLVSPVDADLCELLPLLIHAAAAEALRDDAIRLAEAAKDAGTGASFGLFEDTVPGARRALARAAEHLAPCATVDGQ